MKSALNQQSKRNCSQWFWYTANSCKPWSPRSSSHNCATQHYLWLWQSKGCCVCAQHQPLWKTLANTNLNKIFHMELDYCKKHWTASCDIVHTMNWAENNTQVLHMPKLQSSIPLAWRGRQLSVNYTIFNTAVQCHGTDICRKIKSHSCLLRFPLTSSILHNFIHWNLV